MTDLDKHCDEVVDCDDGLDENNCQLLQIDPERYRKEYPPVSVGKERAMVEIGNLVSISPTFYMQLFGQKCIEQLLFTYWLGLYFFGKSKVA